MVVDRDREHALGLLLTNHILVEDLVDFRGDGQIGIIALGAGLLNFLADNIVAKVDTLIANKHRRARDQLAHLILALAAE